MIQYMYMTRIHNRDSTWKRNGSLLLHAVGLRCTRTPCAPDQVRMWVPFLVCVGTRSDKDLTALFINVLLVFVWQRWKVGRNGPSWALETTLSSPGESAPAQKVTYHERTPSQLHILFLPISLPCSGVLASLAMKHDSHQ